MKPLAVCQIIHSASYLNVRLESIRWMSVCEDVKCKVPLGYVVTEHKALPVAQDVFVVHLTGGGQFASTSRARTAQGTWCTECKALTIAQDVLCQATGSYSLKSVVARRVARLDSDQSGRLMDVAVPTG